MFFGYLRFCTRCRLSWRPALKLNNKSFLPGDVAKDSVSELVAELCTVSLEMDPSRFEVLSSLYKLGEVTRPDSQTYSAQHLRGYSVVLYCRESLRGRARFGAECPSECPGSARGRSHDSAMT